MLAPQFHAALSPKLAWLKAGRFLQLLPGRGVYLLPSWTYQHPWQAEQPLAKVPDQCTSAPTSSCLTKNPAGGEAAMMPTSGRWNLRAASRPSRGSSTWVGAGKFAAACPVRYLGRSRWNWYISELESHKSKTVATSAKSHPRLEAALLALSPDTSARWRTKL